MILVMDIAKSKRDAMLRITKIFENLSLAIYKIEGKVTDESLQIWTDELGVLRKRADRMLILDFYQVWSISAKAIEILVENLSKDMRVMNPSIETRSMLHTAGQSAKILE
jgi:anti-anti-sigma regulatory factor